MTLENSSKPSTSKKQRHKAVRALLIVAGTISLVAGAIGIVVPLVPTTPLMLLAAACYLRSSDRMHNWLINNKYFGSYIKNYQEGRGIPLKSKIIAISTLWATIIISAYFFMPLLIVRVILVIIAVAVSLYLIRLPTYRK